MATSHTGKQNQTGQKQSAAKHTDTHKEPAEGRKQKQNQKRMKEHPNETPPVGEQHEANFEEGQVEHRDEREFVGQMDGAQANKEMEGHAPFERSQQGHLDHPEEMHQEQTKGAMPVEAHRARQDVDNRHK
jgi:hypothetical protein